MKLQLVDWSAHIDLQSLFPYNT